MYCSILSGSQDWQLGEVILKLHVLGSLGGAAVWRLPLAQDAILETRDRVPRRAPGVWSLLLPLPVSLPLSLSLCEYHKLKKKKISERE